MAPAPERLAVAVRTRYAAFRHLGMRHGSRAVARRVVASSRAPIRRAQLRLRPVQIGPSQLASALGGRDGRSALRQGARGALPTVTRWEESLDQLDARQRAGLLARADLIVAHEFDLLGSGPVALGRTIRWAQDFKSGRTWPAVHRSKIRVSYPDDSDIKVPWELSRCQHLPLLAAAHRLSGDARYLEDIGAQLESWIDANPVEIGVNWACTMDVAIRAANWVATLVLCADGACRLAWFDRALGSLLAHGRFIRRHLEYGPARGNHYLSDVVGLQAIAAVFAAGAEGREWARWAADQLVAEMDHQVRADGCDHEASLPYHRLVCELFVCGTQAADALTPGAIPQSYRERLERMLAFVADTTRGDGLSPQMGDADNGRYLPLADYGASDQRDHAHLFAQAGLARPPRPTESAAYPHGGWWVLRRGELFAIVRCGDVGIHGLGCHAHNDQLAFELAHGDQPLIVDPGSYLYTADPAARNAFRATAAHATVAVGHGEQNPLWADRLFAMDDTTRARCLHWQADASAIVWEGVHSGFPMVARDVRHRRRVEVDAAATMRITDAVHAPPSSPLVWSFPLVVGAASTVDERGVTVRAGAVELRIEGDELEWSCEPSWCSPAYGVREAAAVIRARTVVSGTGEVVRSIRLRATARR